MPLFWVSHVSDESDAILIVELLGENFVFSPRQLLATFPRPLAIWNLMVIFIDWVYFYLLPGILRWFLPSNNSRPLIWVLRHVTECFFFSVLFLELPIFGIGTPALVPSSYLSFISKFHVVVCLLSFPGYFLNCHLSSFLLSFSMLRSFLISQNFFLLSMLLKMASDSYLLGAAVSGEAFSSSCTVLVSLLWPLPLFCLLVLASVFQGFRKCLMLLRCLSVF